MADYMFAAKVDRNVDRVALVEQRTDFLGNEIGRMTGRIEAAKEGIGSIAAAGTVSGETRSAVYQSSGPSYGPS